MARDLNQVFLIGRLTRDVELRTTGTGKNVASFALAVNRSEESVDFIECVAWEKTAELLNQYTSKGSKILVQGSLQVREYEDKSGNKRKAYEVIVRDISFLDNKPEGATSATTNTQKKDTVVEDIGDEPINLDDIPF